MYKGKVQSMQRGAQQRHSVRISREQFYAESRSSISKAERDHFRFGAVTTEQFLERVRPSVLAIIQNGFTRGRDVARILNQNNVTTACHSKWSPRTAFFLMQMLRKARRKVGSQTRAR